MDTNSVNSCLVHREMCFAALKDLVLFSSCSQVSKFSAFHQFAFIILFFGTPIEQEWAILICHVMLNKGKYKKRKQFIQALMYFAMLNIVPLHQLCVWFGWLNYWSGTSLELCQGYMSLLTNGTDFQLWQFKGLLYLREWTIRNISLSASLTPMALRWTFIPSIKSFLC